MQTLSSDWRIRKQSWGAAAPCGHAHAWFKDSLPSSPASQGYPKLDGDKRGDAAAFPLTSGKLGLTEGRNQTCGHSEFRSVEASELLGSVVVVVGVS